MRYWLNNIETLASSFIVEQQKPKLVPRFSLANQVGVNQNFSVIPSRIIEKMKRSMKKLQCETGKSHLTCI